MRFHTSKVFLVFLLWFAGLGAAAQFAKVAVPFALVTEAYPEAGSEIGWLLSLVSLVGALLGIVAGGLVGRFGAKNVLLFALFGGAAISFWQAQGLSFLPMLASRVVEGTSHLAIVVAAPTLIAQLSEKRFVGAAMTLWGTFFGVAFAVLAWGILPFMGNGGLLELFTGHAIFMLMIGIAVALTVPKVMHISADAGEAKPGIVETHRMAYASPHIAAPGAGWLLYTLTFVSLMTLIPEQLPPDEAVWAAGLMPLLGIVVSMAVVPVLLRRHSSVTIVVSGFALGAALVALNLAFNLQMPFVLALFSVLGLIQGASFAAIPELNSDAKDQALSYGLLAQAGNIGNLLGTPVLIALRDFGGERGMYLAVILLYLTGIGLHQILARRRSRWA